MADISNNFEGGVDGVTILNTDTGGGTAFDVIQTPASSTVAYTTTSPFDGRVAAKVRIDATAGNTGCQWTTALGSPTDFYTRFFFKADVAPSGPGMIQSHRAASSSFMAGVAYTTARKIAVYNASVAVVATSSVTLSTGQWYRIETFVHGASTATGYVVVRIYTDPLSSSIADTVDGSTAPWAFNASPATAKLNYGGESAGTQWPSSTASEFVYFEKISAGKADDWYGPPAVILPSWSRVRFNG